MANPTFTKEFYSIKSDTLLQVLDTLHGDMIGKNGKIDPDVIISTCDLLEIEMEGQEERGPKCAD